MNVGDFIQWFAWHRFCHGQIQAVIQPVAAADIIYRVRSFSPGKPLNMVRFIHASRAKQLQLTDKRPAL